MKASMISPSSHAVERRKARGFTLIELMVALSGGLVFTIFVFMLARDATRFYQNESRLADATFGAIAGFQRLRNDIARAGYLSTANIQSPRSAFCGNPLSADLGDLADLASLQIEPGGSGANAITGITPDAIVLMGSYASPDQYPIEYVDRVGSGAWVVHFQPGSPAMLRLGYRPADTPPNTQPLVDLFLPGRALRIVDHEGREQYGIVDEVGVDISTPTDPFVTLLPEPSFQRKGGNECGLRGYEEGALVNVVQMIRYDVRSLTTPEFAALYPATATEAVGEAMGQRTELVREERSFADATAALEGTAPELVAEFAVDLKFGLHVLTAANATTTQLATVATIPTYAGPASNASTTNGAAMIRAVRARLSVRSRTADRRDQPLAGSRVNVAPVGQPVQYARMRTLQADIALRNQANPR